MVGLSGSEKLTALERLSVEYPSLYAELNKLPDLKEMGNLGKAAVNNIAMQALMPECRTTFESMMNEGIKAMRKYCTPLQALLWINYDQPSLGNSLLQDYSLAKLIGVAWKRNATLGDFPLERWQDFNEVIDRLNSPSLVSIYMINNIAYDCDERDSIMKGIVRFAPPREIFRSKKGVCNEQARFALQCLMRNGYNYDDFETNENAACMLGIDIIGSAKGHDVCLVKEKGQFFTIDNGALRGPFPDIIAAANSTAKRVNITHWKKCYFRDLELKITEEIQSPPAPKIMIKWPAVCASFSKPPGRFSPNAKDKRGIDLREIRAFMDDDFLYISIQIYGVFEPLLLRNYFIALDLNNDGFDEYEIGLRPDGSTWVFNHIKNKNNWNAEEAEDILVAAESETMLVRIPRAKYAVPPKISIRCRVTEGDPTVDTTAWIEISR